MLINIYISIKIMISIILFLYIAHMVRVDENGYPLTFEARSLAENQMYEFWVSASTSVGEGEPTSVVAQATNTRGRAALKKVK